MARFAIAERSTTAGSSTLPLFSIFCGANDNIKIREIGVFNTTTTAVSLALRRYTAQGTPGTGLTEMGYDLDSVATATAFAAHPSAGPTITTGFLRACTLGAAAGAAMVWTFGDSGLIVPKGTASGIGITSVGTGQLIDFYLDWDE